MSRLSLAPTEDPQVAMLFAQAKREADANGKIALFESDYAELRKPGTVQVGDYIIIHRAAHRDVERDVAAKLWLQVSGSTPVSVDLGIGGDPKIVVPQYAVQGSYMSGGRDAIAFDGTLLLNEDQILLVHGISTGPHGDSHGQSTTANNFRFSGPNDPTRIYVQRAARPDPIDSLSLEPTVDAANLPATPPSDGQQNPEQQPASPSRGEIRRAVVAMRGALGSILAGLRNRS